MKQKCNWHGYKNEEAISYHSERAGLVSLEVREKGDLGGSEQFCVVLMESGQVEERLGEAMIVKHLTLPVLNWKAVLAI